MSILIKGIDMPTNCTRCPCSNDETRYCGAANKYIPMLGKPSFCPLEEVEERKTGHWVEDGYHDGEIVCSECGEPCSGFIMAEPRDKFCKWCGAKMEV